MGARLFSGVIGRLRSLCGYTVSIWAGTQFHPGTLSILRTDPTLLRSPGQIRAHDLDAERNGSHTPNSLPQNCGGLETTVSLGDLETPASPKVPPEEPRCRVAPPVGVAAEKAVGLQLYPYKPNFTRLVAKSIMCFGIIYHPVLILLTHCQSRLFRMNRPLRKAA